MVDLSPVYYYLGLLAGTLSRYGFDNEEINKCLQNLKDELDRAYDKTENDNG